MHEQEIPWKSVAISGWILDPDRKKMSKSAGNVVTPDKLLDENSSDAVRYWASRARLGVDTAFDPTIFQSGRKLSIKLFNITRFILAQVERIGGGITTPPSASTITTELDISWYSLLDNVVRRATTSFEELDFAGALAIIVQSFWEFCDNYVELVKGRSYGEPTTLGRDSAIATLFCSLTTYLRLFAPFLPYITEELWSQLPENRGALGSIHRADWPAANGKESLMDEAYKLACHALNAIRKAKAEAHRGMKWPVLGVKISGASAALFEGVFEDLVRAGAIENNALTRSELNADAGDYEVLVELAREET